MAMSDTFAGLVGMRVMNSAYHDACLQLGSITELNRDPAPFFIARPVEEVIPNKTKTLLDLCKELIEKTEEQQKSLTAMGNEITRLNARIIDMETKMRHREWRNAQREPVYGQREKPKDQTISPDMFRIHEDVNTFRVPDEILRRIDGQPTGPITITYGTTTGTDTVTAGNPIEITSENALLAISDMNATFQRQAQSSRAPEFIAVMEAAHRDYIASRSLNYGSASWDEDARTITPITGVDYDANEPPF